MRRTHQIMEVNRTDWQTKAMRPLHIHTCHMRLLQPQTDRWNSPMAIEFLHKLGQMRPCSNQACLTTTQISSMGPLLSLLGWAIRPLSRLLRLFHQSETPSNLRMLRQDRDATPIEPRPPIIDIMFQIASPQHKVICQRYHRVIPQTVTQAYHHPPHTGPQCFRLTQRKKTLCRRHPVRQGRPHLNIHLRE